MFDIPDVEQEIFRCKTEVQQPLAVVNFPMSRTPTDERLMNA